MEIVQLICNSNQLTGFYNCQKQRNFTNFPDTEILWKGAVARKNCLKLCRNCGFPQNFHTRKLGKIKLIFAVYAIEKWL